VDARVRLTLLLFCLGALHACRPGFAWGQDRDQEDLFQQVFGAPAPSVEPVAIDLELRIQNVPAGEVAARVMGERLIHVSRDSLVKSLEPLLNAAQLARLLALGSDAPPEALASLGFDVRYDPVALALDLSVPVEYRKRWNVAVAPLRPPAPGRRRYRPAAVSAALNLAPRADFDHDRGQTRIGLDAAGWLNVAGYAARGEFSVDSRGETLSRGAVALVRDWPQRRLRAELGEIVAPAFGAQPGVTLRGITLAREFETDPYDPPFPGVLAPLLLERASEIQVRVNQRLVDRVRLPAGPVMLSDLPLSTGRNDVELDVIQDGALRRSLRLDGWFDRTRLGAGRQRFHVSVGQPWTQGRRAPRTVAKTLNLSAAYARGISDRWTAGGGLLADPDASTVVLDTSTDVGFDGFSLSANLAASRLPAGEGLAGSATVQSDPAAGRWLWQAGLVWRGAGFVPFGLSQPPGERFSASLRLSRNLFGRWRFGVSGSADRIENSRTAGARATLAWRPGPSINAEITVSSRFGEQPGDHALTTSLIWRPGSGAHSFAAEIDDGGRWLAGWQLNRQSSRSGYSASAFVGDDDSGTRAEASGAMRTHRLQLRFRHIRGIGDGADSTRLTGNTALVFADGRFGIAERVDDAFVLFDAREGTGAVFVNPSDGDWRARSGPLGPAVIGNLTPYLERGFALSLPDVPLRRDPGDVQPVAVPTYLSGVRVEVGPLRTVAVRFLLVDNLGEPVRLAAGSLQKLDGDGEFPFFSNRTGRVIVSGVAPGRYRVVLRDGSVLAEDVVVAADPLEQNLGSFRT
jgi:outer membrane usher protein